MRSISDKPVFISGGVLPIMDSDLLDGESALMLAPPSVPPLSDVFVENLAATGKVHRARRFDMNEHPRHWRSWCGWRFGLPEALYEILKTEPDAKRSLCRSCTGRKTTVDSDSSSDESSSSDSSLKSETFLPPARAAGG